MFYINIGCRVAREKSYHGKRGQDKEKLRCYFYKPLELKMKLMTCEQVIPYVTHVGD